jgi:hypothetical protein
MPRDGFGDGYGAYGDGGYYGDGGVNNPQAPWDGGMPDPDPDFRYREPGPGMPGYRGSRDYRYGGDAR